MNTHNGSDSGSNDRPDSHYSNSPRRSERLGKFGLLAVGAVGGVLVSLGISALAQRFDPLPLKQLQQFANVFSTIKNSYVEPLPDDKLINSAIKGMFEDLDPHSIYLDEQAFKEMEEITQGGFGGLGIEIGREDGMPKVIAPIEDTPAERAGVLAGDLITHIDGKATKGMTLNDAVKLMRGEPGTPIDLTIQREGQDRPVQVNIVRDLIKVRSVRSERLADDIAYIRIAQFQERTVPDLLKHLHDVAQPSIPKGLVLDLRNDPGGLLGGAIGVTSAFLPPGTLVVSTKGRIPSSNREYHSRNLNGSRWSGEDNTPALPDWTRSVPLVVLVNVGSASASEIVAGALQDHQRATIMGNRSFGKGSVQSVLPLGEDSGIKLTTARYYTPSGRSIQVTGVEPDITVDDTALGNLFSLPREGDLDHHLQGADEDSATDTASPTASANNEPGGEADSARPQPFQFGSSEDFQLQQAINHLQGKPVKRNELGSEPGNAETAEPETAQTEHYRLTPQGIVPLKP